MGIDNVAIKTFNSTGAQSVCRANEADSSKLIESQFLSKCTTEYINGSGMSHINGLSVSIGDGATTTAPADEFYLPNDCDAISDVIYNGALVGDIKHIEVFIGQLKAQTIYPYDIISRNSTELGSSVVLGTTKTFSIPFIGRAKNAINSFLQAGAMTNQIRLKVTYNSIINTDAGGAGAGIWSSGAAITWDASVCVFSHQITNTEKNFIAKNIVNRPVHMSQNPKSAGVPLTTTATTLDLSAININVSHILIYCTSLKSAELILGNDRTGDIPSAALLSSLNSELFSLAGNHANVYIIKTADSAFSTAGIPFARLSNRQLKLTATQATTAYVTVCGTQVQTTVGGTISFSA